MLYIYLLFYIAQVWNLGVLMKYVRIHFTHI